MILYLEQLARTSCMMAGLSLLYVAAGKFLSEKYAAGDLYLIGKLLLLGFLIPFRLRITLPDWFGRRQVSDFGKISVWQEISENTKLVYISEKNVFSLPGGISWMQLLFFLWMAGAAVTLIWQVGTYLRFRTSVMRRSEAVTDRQTLAIFHTCREQMGISEAPSLRKCAFLSSPMLIGLRKPVIFLTGDSVSAEELRLLLRHELTHLKRKDLWYQWGMLFAVSIHWFQPAVYLFSGSFRLFGEVSCDERAAADLSEEERYGYSRMLIRMAGRAGKQNSLLTSFLNGGRNAMKRRLDAIWNRKKRGGILLFSFWILAVTGAGTVITSYAAESGYETDFSLGYVDNGIKSSEEIADEMEKAFSEVFSNEFREADFPGMIITYDEDGIPIVTDPNVIQKRGVTAVGKYEKNGFYSSSDCTSSNLLFYILKGQEVEVLDSSYTTTAAKVKYAGKTGYMKKSELKF